MAKAYDYRASNDYALFLFNEDDVDDDEGSTSVLSYKIREAP